MLRILAAAAMIAAISTAAFAAEQPAGPRVVGDGDNLRVEYPTPSQNVVGGAVARVTGPAGQYHVEVLRVERTQPAGTPRPVAQALVVDSAS